MLVDTFSKLYKNATFKYFYLLITYLSKKSLTGLNLVSAHNIYCLHHY